MSRKKTTLLDVSKTFRPFHYSQFYDAWKQHEHAHWLFTEVSMADDINDFNSVLTESEKNFLTHIFRFFTQGDIDVAGNYVKLLQIFKAIEVRMMLLGYASRECVHIAGYSHLIETLGMPETTYNEFMQYKAMADKHDYISSFDNVEDKRELVKNLAVFSAFTEGMQLFSSFIMLLNFARHGKMKGMGQIISWSIVDETLHTNNMIDLTRALINENKDIWKSDLKKEIYAIANKMVELEDAFIDLAFSMGPMENMTPEDVKLYIRFICDLRLKSLGLKTQFNIERNPLPWVELMINAPSHTNFFENRAVDYAKAATTGGWDEVWGQELNIA